MSIESSNSIRNTKPNLVVTVGSWIAGVGLILLALQCFVYPDVAKGYGVSPVDDNGFAYLLATGMRDLFMGVATIYLLLWHRTALPFYFLAMLIVPIADTSIVLRYGDSWISTLPHVIGIIGLAVLSWLAYREQGRKGDAIRPPRR